MDESLRTSPSPPQARVDRDLVLNLRRWSVIDLNVDEIVVLLACAGLLTLTLPFTFTPASSARLVVVVALLPLGIVRLAALALRREPAGVTAVCFLIWVSLSSLLSDAPGIALLGAYGRDTSALILIGSFGGWAVARGITSAGRHLLPHAIVGGLLASVLVVVLQLIVQAPSGTFGLVLGRAYGLASGPIFLGGLMAGGVGLVATRYVGRAALVLIALFAACINWSGSRFPVIAGLLASIAIPLWHRETRRAALQLVAYLVGLAISVLVSTFLISTASAADRAGAEAAGRLRAWRYGIQAVGDRPIFGWGPGNFRSAVQGRFSADFTSRHARQELTQIWFDAHNVGITALVSFGIVGFVLCALFVWFAVRGSSGGLLAFAVIVASYWLLEPAALATLPVAFIALGAAAPDVVSDPLAGHDSADDRLARVLALGGVLFGTLVLVADVQLASATRSGDPDRVASAAAWTPWDPVAANAAAAAYFNSGSDEATINSALVWIERARDRQPDWPFYRNAVAQVQLELADTAAAKAELEAALELQPWNVQSLELMYEVAIRSGDDDLAETTADKLCEVAVELCP